MKNMLLTILVLVAPLKLLCQGQSELRKQLEVKEEQLEILIKRIIEQEAYIVSVGEKLKILSVEFKERKRAELVQQNTKQEVTDKDLQAILMSELKRFSDSYCDINSPKDSPLLSREFFDENAYMLKFYTLVYVFETTKREELLCQFECLFKEIDFLTKELKFTN